MIENNPISVVAVFEILLEEIEAEIDFVNRVSARAFESRDYGRAKEALERVRQRMQEVLRDADDEPLASEPEMPRWGKTRPHERAIRW